MPLVTEAAWLEFMRAHPNAHLLQTAAWGRFKSHYGWDPKFLIKGDSGAMVLFRRLPMKQSLAYIPKGPVGPDWTGLLEEALDLANSEGAFLVYVEPDAEADYPDCLQLSEIGFTPSTTSIQPRQTLIISLEGEEEDWLARMKQKTRYNIRLAEKKDVHIERSSDVDAFAALMAVTGERDEFGIHSAAYYRQVYDYFAPEDACAMFMATYQGQPLAAIMVFARGERAWYFYGASNNRERNRMPTYLLQYEAMRWAAARGVKYYDLWGIPDYPEETLEAQFTDRADGLWGVYRFKRGFGGQVVRSAGVFEKVLKKPVAALYRLVLKTRKTLVS